MKLKLSDIALTHKLGLGMKHEQLSATFGAIILVVTDLVLITYDPN
jgi:hypothetical protein